MFSLTAQVVNKTNDDQVTVIGAGVTLHEALAAAEQLKKGTRKKKHCLYQQSQSEQSSI